MTLVQRFGSALNLNIHLHMLCLDGVYAPRPDRGLRFTRVKAPCRDEPSTWCCARSRRWRARTGPVSGWRRPTGFPYTPV
ncbi:MAG: transposase [Gammaproteobacteria bacterium]|nr:transposase [Gammaproteobacteria bacterium]MBK9468794.1 transposase [Gammaproteobacteria bacterium]MBP6481878.1 transposase [Pseudomonadales bacterium]MBP7909863.1 transposase [Pseudomonadales bacterium]